jgi:hypothetical protein
VPRQLDHGLLQASSPEQLRLLGLQGPDGSPLALPRPVDFDHWRLLVLPLPPQPARLATPRVERRAKAYRLSYTTMARADQQPAVPHVVWWLLPRDDREVELKQSPYIAAKKPVAPSRWFQSGVLREAQVRFSHRGERW